ncbi:MAG: hypothetical protein IJ406_06505 [Oscillospiraceae bacterium]|nr:hypothetical protein [Oscillospiraceae bacterium]
MSNYDLEAKLSSLESELRHAESINRELRGELSIIEHGVNRADNNLENLNNHISSNLGNCNNIMLSSHQRVIDSIEIQGEIERMYVRFKHMELANKKIRAANNKKYYDFSNYRTVRKIVQGILDNLDIRMVSDKAILKSVEKQHLQTPDYWLTCVLLSIMAWKNDDKELADRAMDRAIKLDKKHSAIFYMLFNLRVNRNEAALKWFYLYQECDLKGSDQRTFLMLFSLISKTLSDNIDDSAKNEIFDFIKRVISANIKASGYSEEIVVERIKGYLNKMKPDDKLEYVLLRKHCLEIDKMADVMMNAKNNIKILEFILKTVNVPIEQKNNFLKEYIDEIIAAPNKTEKEVYDEIEYNELIIKLEGDIDKAREDFAEEQRRRENDLNLVAEMISWIYERDIKEINGQIRLNMFTLTKHLQEEAVDQIVDNYRNNFRVNYDISIGDYSTNVNFKHEDEEY